MRNKVIIFGLLTVAIAFVMLGAGCFAPKDQDTPTEEEGASVNQDVGEIEVGDDSGESEDTNIGVTKEELDQFKIDIENMEYEDLNELKN